MACEHPGNTNGPEWTSLDVSKAAVLPTDGKARLSYTAMKSTTLKLRMP